MKAGLTVCCVILLSISSAAREKPKPHPEPPPVTVPATIDHNRVVIDADIPLPNGSTRRVHAWVDNGNPDLYLSRKLATIVGLNVSCDDKTCSAPPPPAIVVGGMALPLTDVKKAEIPLKPVSAAAVLAPGMNVDINIPSIVLRHYDVLVDFPEHKFTIGAPGAIHFLGSSGKVEINAQNGLIQVPSKIENKKYDLALDMGASISFLSDWLFDELAAGHADWPHMTGAVGPANMWGADAETKWKVMRLDRLQYGPLYLIDVPVVELAKPVMDFLEKRAGTPTEGLIGSNVLLNYRVGLDYAHSMVYFDIGRLYTVPDFDVVGLTLRPEDDGQYSILGVVDFEGTPAVPVGPDGVEAGDHLVAVDDIGVRGATMGQVWSMLGGTPGKQRKLTIERAGKQLTVMAKVLTFLAPAPERDTK
ncbi:MAG TPA: hypothetical protein VMG31_16875 [Verrucomicrobiae bacterium]|nr:hypothetical protein [Verrucomicrobiae bacterium]